MYIVQMFAAMITGISPRDNLIVMTGGMEITGMAGLIMVSAGMITMTGAITLSAGIITSRFAGILTEEMIIQFVSHRIIMTAEGLIGMITIPVRQILVTG
jgi:hypothetical protein